MTVETDGELVVLEWLIKRRNGLCINKPFSQLSTSFSVTSQGRGLVSFFPVHMPNHAESTLVFDSFDLDLVVKVLAQTAFSKMLRHARALSPN
jgi:hypothetical protein